MVNMDVNPIQPRHEEPPISLEFLFEFEKKTLDTSEFHPLSTLSTSSNSER